MREIAMFILIVSIIYTVVILVWANKLYLKRKQREWIKSQNFNDQNVVTITADGQIDVPKSTRDTLSVKIGDSVRFIKIADGIVVIAQVPQ